MYRTAEDIEITIDNKVFKIINEPNDIDNLLRQLREIDNVQYKRTRGTLTSMTNQFNVVYNNDFKIIQSVNTGRLSDIMFNESFAKNIIIRDNLKSQYNLSDLIVKTRLLSNGSIHITGYFINISIGEYKHKNEYKYFMLLL